MTPQQVLIAAADSISKGDTKIATGKIAVKCVSKKPGEAMKSIDIPPEIDAVFQVAPGA